jgi:hypothetical protein
MGQQEVLDFLETHEGWFTTRELAERLDTGRGSLTVCLRKLFLCGDIIRKYEKAKTIWNSGHKAGTAFQWKGKRIREIPRNRSVGKINVIPIKDDESVTPKIESKHL